MEVPQAAYWIKAATRASFTMTWTRWSTRSSCCRHTCLSLFINLITIIRENHRQLMRHLWTKLWNNKQQNYTWREKLQTNLLWLWMSGSLRTLYLLLPNADGKQNLLLSFVTNSPNTTSPRSLHHNNKNRSGVSVQWELGLFSDWCLSRWTGSLAKLQFQCLNRMNSELW